MKKKLIKILKEKGEVNATDLHFLIPESKGDYAMYLPVPDGYNKKTLILSGVNMKFVKAFNEVSVAKHIEIKESNILNFIWDNSPIYSNIPLMSKPYVKKNVERWLPVRFKWIE